VIKLSRRRLSSLLLSPLLVVPPLLVAPSLSHAAPADLASQPISRMDLPWWRRRFEEKQARLRQGADLLWLGDSITQNWEAEGPAPWYQFAPIWAHYYGHRNAVNLGFKGDTTASLLWRLRNGELENIAPRAAIMLIGANNFGHVHWDAGRTVEGIETNLAELRRRTPRTNILLLSILPSDRGAWVTENTQAANRLLATRYGKGAGRTQFIDLTHLFVTRAGEIDRDRFLDRHLTPPDPALHPTPEAMDDMARAIEPTLALMLGGA